MRQQIGCPAPARSQPISVYSRRCRGEPRRETLVDRVVVVEGDPDLLEIVLALCPEGGLPDFLDRWQQHTDQDADNRDDHEQLDQRKGSTAGIVHVSLHVYDLVIPKFHTMYYHPRNKKVHRNS